MSHQVAPWLEGLSETWDPPAETTNLMDFPTSADSPQEERTRLPSRSLSGLPSTLGSQKSTSNATTQIKRSPLATLSNNDANSIRRGTTRSKLGGARSVSAVSEGSGFCGTVAVRSKSTSPTKQQQTLEWKRRLVEGKVGYGDQTDLFGATGLENIFAPTSGPENEAPKPKGKMAWLQKSDAMMPSSPPPWSGTRGHADEEYMSDAGSLEREQSLSQRSSERGDDDFLLRSGDCTGYDNQDAQEDDGTEVQDNSDGAQASNQDWNEVVDEQEHSARDLASDQGSVVRPPKGGNRAVSGQTDFSQEDFSPVFISKHTTMNGQVNYAALDSHLVERFQNMDVNLRHPSQEHREDTTQYSKQAKEKSAIDKSAFTDGPESDAMRGQPDLSLPDGLPTNTPPVASIGRFVNINRGGFSAIGSFKQKPLSPSQSTKNESFATDRSGMLSVADARGGKAVNSRSSAPSTPMRPRSPSPEKTRSSGSPLKLFGPHDTFTSNRLLRRMSQLDPEDAISEAEKVSPGMQRRSTEQKPKPHAENRTTSSGSYFGQGSLDKNTFNAEITVTSASDSTRAGSVRSPGSEIPPPGSRIPAHFREEPSQELKDAFKLKRKLSKHSTAGSRDMVSRAPSGSLRKDAATGAGTGRDTLHAHEGKRPPTSPFKDPTPKRRRTLHASEMEEGVTNMSRSYQEQMRDALNTRKRKDARTGESQAMADPKVLAQRKIIRPRNPTPSQQRREEVESEIREATEDFISQDPERLEAVMEQIESSMMDGTPKTLKQQAQAVAKEVAAFTLRVHKASAEHGERKRSVTTQDYMNEAMMVMQFIRNKSRPQSGLDNVEESDAEAYENSLYPDGPVQQESLRLSRPPSREGRISGWRTRSQQQLDPRVVSHLRRFQERDDTNFIEGTVHSLHLEEDDGRHEYEGEDVVHDEHSNIRITGPPSKHDRPTSQGIDVNTKSSDNSNGTSTGRTLGTNSTRKSDNVGTLAPDAVAHLIGEQVGGMTFDREKNRWVRVKSPQKKKSDFLEPPSNITSDDDPFREISDLKVDDPKEQRPVSGTSQTGSARVPENASVHDQQPAPALQPSVESRMTSEETVVARPTTRGSSTIHHAHSSSAPSRYTMMASSQMAAETGTRATSWNDEELARMSALGKARQQQQPLAYAAARAEIERRQQDEQTLQELSSSVSQQSETFSTAQNPPVRASYAKSSGIRPTESEAPEEYDETLTGLRDDTALDLADEDIGGLESPKMRSFPARTTTTQPSIRRGTQRQTSLRRKTLTGALRPDPRDQSELSFVAALSGDRMMSLSLSVSKPAPQRYQPVGRVLDPSSPSKGEATFMLSDLPEFTVHEEDVERPSERALAQRVARHANEDTKDRYTMAVKQVVKTLQDVREDEPYWEDIKQLDLRDRSLASLHGLEDFCTRVQNMDVSANTLNQLHGAPSTIRSLIAQSNQLTSLTHWGHLSNLQYLDISGNELSDCNSLGHLIHLRELKADDNAITNLDGLLELDGLLKLSLCRNQLASVDFTDCQLQRLTSLNLANNEVRDVKGLNDLSSLERLVLDDNLLASGLAAVDCMTSIKSLSAKSCNLSTLDVAAFPNLQDLYLDNNHLATVEHLDSLKHLRFLSMRNQELPEGTTLDLFSQQIEARTIQLSANVITSLRLPHTYLNVQHLEIASTGLQELPVDFGQRMPNLRTLNLNYNALQDLRPLLNIHRLQKLNLCGNRLARLRKSVTTLSKIKGLSEIDLRDNDFTKGFYAPTGTMKRAVERDAGVLTTRSNSLKPFAMDDLEGEEALAERAQASAFVSPASDAELDRQHLRRLDEDTKLRRRVYELLLAHSCPDTRLLDGLPFAKEKAMERDGIWERLVDLGIVRKSNQEGVEEFKGTNEQRNGA
ncbi:hypothetical protein MBLNU230_g1755t1 [Neophaeotheca triangularis]